MQARLICALCLLIVLGGACSRQETPKALAGRLSNEPEFQSIQYRPPTSARQRLQPCH
jgi:hypothetical protein